MASFKFEIKDHVGIVTLDRPPLNAFLYETYEELMDIFKGINSNDDVRTVILRAEGKNFTVGNDVAEFLSYKDEKSTKKHLDTVTEGICSVYECRVPVIGAIQGACVGTGLAIAACCDNIVASEDAYFGIPEIKIGIIGACSFLAQMVPDKRMRYLAYTGNNVMAKELIQYGSVLKVVPREDLFQTAWGVAEEFLKNGPIALRYFKESMSINFNPRLKEKYGIEATYTMKYYPTYDFKEAVNAFLDKRKPDYKCK